MDMDEEMKHAEELKVSRDISSIVSSEEKAGKLLSSLRLQRQKTKKKALTDRTSPFSRTFFSPVVSHADSLAPQQTVSQLTTNSPVASQASQRLPELEIKDIKSISSIETHAASPLFYQEASKLPAYLPDSRKEKEVEIKVSQNSASKIVEILERQHKPLVKIYELMKIPDLANAGSIACHLLNNCPRLEVSRKDLQLKEADAYLAVTCATHFIVNLIYFLLPIQTAEPEFLVEPHYLPIFYHHKFNDFLTRKDREELCRYIRSAIQVEINRTLEEYSHLGELFRVENVDKVLHAKLVTMAVETFALKEFVYGFRTILKK